MRLSVCFVVLFPVLTFGQSLNIIVQDSTTQAALPFANLYFQKSGIGASTNMDGVATFKPASLVPEDSLVISYIGYHTRTIAISKSRLENTYEVRLRPEVQALREVVVGYEEPPKPQKIIRTALKNTRDNYPNEDVIYKTIYRETIKEDDTFIQLNEAFLKVYYTGYPQKRLDRKIWRDWHYDDSYAFDLDGDRYFYPLLKDFNTKQEQQTVVASRYSNNQSEYEIETTLIGDPLLLFALDKIKYQYDFFNPAKLNKYRFKHETPEIVGGELCYVLSFYPKKTGGKFKIDQARKNKSPIYIGRMYISKESFALVKFAYKLAVDRDYGFFARSMPLDYRVEWVFKKSGDTYYIDQVELTDTKTVGKKTNGDLILHTARRVLKVTDVDRENVSPFPDSALFKSTRFSSIRYYQRNYNPDFWTGSGLAEKFPLDPELVRDLEREEPLSRQFSSFSPDTKREVPVPTVLKVPHSFTYHGEEVMDSLHWMAVADREKGLKKYLREEKDFALNELIEDKAYQKKLFDDLNAFFPEEDQSAKEAKPGTYLFDQDSLENDVLYYQQDSVNRISVLNVTWFEENHKEVYINRFLTSPGRNYVAVKFSRPGILGDFVRVLPFGDTTQLGLINQVYEVEWLSDSTLLYSKTDKVGRGGELVRRHVVTGLDSVVYYESDPTFDIALKRQNDQVLCTIQSKTENEVYLVKDRPEKTTLQLVKKRAAGVMNDPVIKEGVYILVNDEETGSSIQFAAYENPKPRVLTTLGEADYVTDIVPGKDKIVALVYRKSIPGLMVFDQALQEWQELNLGLGIGQYFLYSSQTDTTGFRFSFSSPSRPATVFWYDFNTRQLNELSKVPVDEHVYEQVSVKRIWAKSHDGIKVPLTVFRNRAARNARNCVLLKSYGAYGAITTPSFSAREALLLKEGYTIAYAHVRGESILGTNWYQQGRGLRKVNSIQDYLSSAEHLQKMGFETIIGYGNSAGGLIVAQAMNIKPELFNSVILDHAYLDVVNTMMNDTLPLTIDEYKEWGNPQEKDVYDYMMTYSPYQNIKPQKYPNVLLLGSYLDYQTPIWQIAKYTARLREHNQSDTAIILLTDMSSGHQGNTTGKEWMKVFAQTYSFVRQHLPGSSH